MATNEQITCNIVKQIFGYRVANFRNERYVGAVDCGSFRRAVTFAREDVKADRITVRRERGRVWHKLQGV